MKESFLWLAAATLILSTTACGRWSSSYRSFAASHDAIKQGMTLRQVYEAGLLKYATQTTVPGLNGVEVSIKESENTTRCKLKDIRHGSSASDFRIYIQNGASRDIHTFEEFLEELDRVAQCTSLMSYYVESPQLGIYCADSYDFSFDAQGKLASLTPINVHPWCKQ